MVFGSSNNNVGTGFPPNIFLSPPPYPPTLSGNIGDIFASSMSALSPLSQNQGDTFTYSASARSSSDSTIADLMKQINKSKGRNNNAVDELFNVVMNDSQKRKEFQVRFYKMQEQRVTKDLRTFEDDPENEKIRKKAEESKKAAALASGFEDSGA